MRNLTEEPASGKQKDAGVRTLGQINYDAFVVAAGGKTPEGQPMATWITLGKTAGGRAIRCHWESAAEAVSVEIYRWNEGDSRSV